MFEKIRGCLRDTGKFPVFSHSSFPHVRFINRELHSSRCSSLIALFCSLWEIAVTHGCYSPPFAYISTGNTRSCDRLSPGYDRRPTVSMQRNHEIGCHSTRYRVRTLNPVYTVRYCSSCNGAGWVQRLLAWHLFLSGLQWRNRVAAVWVVDSCCDGNNAGCITLHPVEPDLTWPVDLPSA
jgi:hypothetical protein